MMSTKENNGDNVVAGEGSSGGIDDSAPPLRPEGVLNVLVVPVYPADRQGHIKNGTGEIAELWKNVKKYYGQASYGHLTVSVRCANWSPLSGDSATYVTNEKKNGEWVGVAPNVKYEDDHRTLQRLWSEAAQAAKGQRIDPGKYDVLVCLMNLDGNGGHPIRGYGGYSCGRLQYKDDTASPPLDIDIPLKKRLMLIVLDEQASWGHCAHEVGHCLVSAPDIKGDDFCEDLYPDLGVDATAAGFDLMGDHEEAPLFSGYYMERLGFYGKGRVLEVDWGSCDRFSREIEVSAHGLEASKGGYRLVKIRVADGLWYYVEVRQRSMGGVTTGQVFDKRINLGQRCSGLSDDANAGGVLVTQVVTGPTVSSNQKMRFITLMQNQERLTSEEYAKIKKGNSVDLRLPHVMKAGNGSVASDPMRGIKITALEPVADRPLTYKVRVEWNKGLLGISDGAASPVPGKGGAFDLWISHDDNGRETQDIWVESPPFGDKKWDYGYDDTEKRPMYGGDRPVPGVENRIWARVRCSGDKKARDVGVHFYGISPPGIGHNGNWSPINFKTGSVKKGRYKDFGPVTWTPVDDSATALTVCIDPGENETVYSDNWAQEVVFDMDSHYVAESDTPAEVPLSFRLHNPLGARAKAYVKNKNLPGFEVKLPEAVWLDPGESEKMDVMIRPSEPYRSYAKKYGSTVFKVQLVGYVADAKNAEHRVGGVSAWVSLKQQADVKIWENKETSDGSITVDGCVEPKAAGKIHVALSGPEGERKKTKVEHAIMGKDGKFSASFTGLGAGKYKLQAQIVNSGNVARAKSNTIYVTTK